MIYSKQKAKKLLRLGCYGLWLALTLMIFFPAFVHAAEVTVAPAQARPGDSIVISGQGFPANQTLTIALESPQSSVDIGVAKTDSRGVFSTQIATPVEMEPGDYRLKVTGGENATEVDFRILAEAAASSSGPIQVFERTIGETITIALIILVCIAAGTILILVARKSPVRPVSK